MPFKLEEAMEACAASQLVSIDIFDTALARIVDQPRDIFRMMESFASAELGRPLPTFSRDRILAEAAAKTRTARQGLQVTLEQVYEELRRILALSADQARSLARLEIETESRSVYSVPNIREIYRHARALNKSVIFLSDMYLPSDCLRQMLETQGYADPVVYVSAECGGNKASGALYRIVREKLGFPANRCVHFGDNFYADVIRPRLQGWRAIHTPAPRRQRKEGTLAGSIARGVVQKDLLQRGDPTSPADHAFWEEFGFETVGPIYFGYLHWLHRRAHQDNVKRLLFCARDGFPLFRGMQILGGIWAGVPDATYFYASRQLINGSAIRRLTPSACDFLLMANPGLSLRDFVQRLGLDASEQEPALLQLGFTSLDMPITHDYFGRFLKPNYKTSLEGWLRQQESGLLARFAENRVLLDDYFQRAAVESPDAALVDIGWNATVARGVQELVAKKRPGFNLRAYFFGTSSGASKFVQAGGRPDSFFVKLGMPRDRERLVALHEGVIEFLFAAPHGSITGLRRDADGIQPIFGECEYNPAQLASLEHMRQSAYRFIAEAARLLPDPLASEPADDHVEAVLNQVLLRPTRRQARSVGEMPYRVSYGGLAPLRSFALVAGEDKFGEMFRAYGRSQWRNGFLALVAPEKHGPLRLALSLAGAWAALCSGTFLQSVKWALFRR